MWANHRPHLCPKKQSLLTENYKNKSRLGCASGRASALSPFGAIHCCGIQNCKGVINRIVVNGNTKTTDVLAAITMGNVRSLVAEIIRRTRFAQLLQKKKLSNSDSLCRRDLHECKDSNLISALPDVRLSKCFLSAAYSVTDAMNLWLSPSNNRGALCVRKGCDDMCGLRRCAASVTQSCNYRKLREGCNSWGYTKTTRLLVAIQCN